MHTRTRAYTRVSTRAHTQRMALKDGHTLSVLTPPPMVSYTVLGLLFVAQAANNGWRSKRRIPEGLREEELPPKGRAGDPGDDFDLMTGSNCSSRSSLWGLFSPAQPCCGRQPSRDHAGLLSPHLSLPRDAVPTEKSRWRRSAASRLVKREGHQTPLNHRSWEGKMGLPDKHNGSCGEISGTEKRH